MIYIRSDDAATRHTLHSNLHDARMTFEPFATNFDSLRLGWTRKPSCLILDLGLADGGAIKLIKFCNESVDLCLPIIGVTTVHDISLTARAMRMGVINVHPLPLNQPELLGSIHESFAISDSLARKQTDLASARQQWSVLSARERQLVGLICEGMSSKQIASHLRISAKTVANHRSKIMIKVGAINTADLVRISLASSAPLLQPA